MPELEITTSDQARDEIRAMMSRPPFQRFMGNARPDLLIDEILPLLLAAWLNVLTEPERELLRNILDLSPDRRSKLSFEQAAQLLQIPLGSIRHQGAEYLERLRDYVVEQDEWVELVWPVRAKLREQHILCDADLNDAAIERLLTQCPWTLDDTRTFDAWLQENGSRSRLRAYVEVVLFSSALRRLIEY